MIAAILFLAVDIRSECTRSMRIICIDVHAPQPRLHVTCQSGSGSDFSLRRMQCPV
jgi:hypothetical protein